jgi:soluble lytic murein transglycosylase-like protein
MEQDRRKRASALITALILVLAVSGCALVGSGGSTAGSTLAPAADVDPSATAGDVAPEATPVVTTAAAKPKAKAKPTKKPAAKASSPAVPVDDGIDDNGQSPDCQPTRKGPAASRAKVKAAFTAAASRQYWKTEAPKLRVPLKLIEVIAFQESGWTSNLYACDGGVGLMQVMPDTRDHINLRFGLTYDIEKYQDNAFLGGNYLAFLIKELGNTYFAGSYDVSPAKCKSHSDRCLLNAVIAAYNGGQGAAAAALDAKGPLPSLGYVDSVRGLMATCKCLKW